MNDYVPVTPHFQLRGLDHSSCGQEHRSLQSTPALGAGRVAPVALGHCVCGPVGLTCSSAARLGVASDESVWSPGQRSAPATASFRGMFQDVTGTEDISARPWSS